MILIYYVPLTLAVDRYLHILVLLLLLLLNEGIKFESRAIQASVFPKTPHLGLAVVNRGVVLRGGRVVLRVIM